MEKKLEVVEITVANTIENVVEGGKGLTIVFNGKYIGVLSTKDSVEPVFHFEIERKALLKLLKDK
jgi:hypothetical protein